MTRSARRSRWLPALACAATLAVAGCTPGGGEEEPDVTPEQASQQLRDVAEAVLAAVAPEAPARLGDARDRTPCGGVEGTSYSRIKTGLTGVAGSRVDDPDTAFAAAREALTGQGATFDDVREVGEGQVLLFRSDAFGGQLVLHPDGKVVLNAETACLDNPDES